MLAGKETAYLSAANEWRRRYSRSSGGQPEELSLLKLGGVTRCRKSIILENYLHKTVPDGCHLFPIWSIWIGRCRTQRCRSYGKPSRDPAAWTLDGALVAKMEGITASRLSRSYPLVAYSIFVGTCWKGIAVELLHVWHHLTVLLGRWVLPRSAYRLIHNSVCLNNPHAKLQDLEIKDLSTVTIMKDPKSADLAIDEEASV